MLTLDDTTPAERREAALMFIGAGGIRRRYRTADVVYSATQGALFIVVDPYPEVSGMDEDSYQAEWGRVCDVIRECGFHNGTDGPYTDDPGKPKELFGVCAWRLKVPTAPDGAGWEAMTPASDEGAGWELANDPRFYEALDAIARPMGIDIWE